MSSILSGRKIMTRNRIRVSETFLNETLKQGTNTFFMTDPASGTLKSFGETSVC